MRKILPLIFVFFLCGCINRFHSEAEERYNFFIDSIKHGFDSSQSIVDEGMVYEDDSVYIRRFDLKVLTLCLQKHIVTGLSIFIVAISKISDLSAS